MIDKEVDVLMKHIVDEENFDIICDYLNKISWCEEHCDHNYNCNIEGYKECVRQYARLKAKEGAE